MKALNRVVTSAWAPKSGHTSNEYEDAFAFSNSIGNRPPRRCALADGATTTSFSREWAGILVNGYAAQTDNVRSSGVSALVTNFTEQLTTLRSEWLAQTVRRPLPWYAEAKLTQGAYASFLGLSFRDVPVNYQKLDTILSAFAIGDTCLFHVRNDAVIASFPIDTVTTFQCRPTLVSTRTGDEIDPAAFATYEATLQPNDKLLLMTDALAEWFLTANNAGEEPWKQITLLLQRQGRSPQTSCFTSDFHIWLDDLRERKQIADDDVTICSIEVSSS